MSSFERSDIRARIEEDLDPEATIRADVEAGVPQQQGVEAYAQELVGALDAAFSNEGGSGVSAGEMRAYVEWLIADVTEQRTVTMEQAISGLPWRDFVAGSEEAHEIALEWVQAGFTPEQAEPYWDAECFDAVRTAKLRDAGITPAEAARLVAEDVGSGGYSATIGYKVSNADLDVDEALAIVADYR